MKLHLPASVLRTLIASAAIVPAVYGGSISDLPSTSDVEITLTENTSVDKQGTALINKGGSVSFNGNNQQYDLTFSNATVQIFNLNDKKTLSFNNMDSFAVSDCTVDGSSGFARTNGGTWTQKNQACRIEITDNASVLFQDNATSSSTQSYLYGGAIYGFIANVRVNKNDVISFEGNKAENLKTGGVSASGGALYITGHNLSDGRDFEMCNNGAVSFTGNQVTGGCTMYGGAVTIATNMTAEWDNNASITFENNAATSTKGDADGGALYVSDSSLTISNTTGEVLFRGNTTTGVKDGGGYSQGGAISAESSSIIAFSGNNSVKFENNSTTGTATGAKHGSAGGAVYLDAYSKLSMTGNNTINFSGNTVTNTQGSQVQGGAINSTQDVNIRDNGVVVFEKNAEISTAGTRLRSIYVSEGNLNLSAADVGSITVKDSIYVGGNLNLNEAYEGRSQGGAIVFSGASVVDDLEDIKGSEATATEVTNSLTNTVKGSITLYNGTLSLQDDAVLKATELIIKEGATLEGIRTEDEAVMVFAMSAEDEALLGSVATLDANLVLEDGALINMVGGALDLNGKALTTGDNIQVSYTGNATEGEEVVLFKNVGNIDDNATEFELVFNGKTTTATLDNGNVVVEYAAAVPEPTTATLSLMALAALAMRRRRK